MLTSCPARAYSLVARVLAVASDVSYSCVEQSLLSKVFSVHVLHAPKTAGGDGSLLCAFWDTLGIGLGCETHCAGGKGPREALEDGRHGVGADDAEEKYEDLVCWLQVCGGLRVFVGEWVI